MQIPYESKVADDRLEPAPGMVCPKCKGGMIRGTILDQAPGDARLPQWAPIKRVIKTWFGVRVTADALPVETYRCSRCGFLESYAGYLKTDMQAKKST